MQSEKNRILLNCVVIVNCKLYFVSTEVAGLVSDDDLSDNRSDCSEQDGQIDGTKEKRLKVKMEEESKGEISPIDENEEWAKVINDTLGPS